MTTKPAFATFASISAAGLALALGCGLVAAAGAEELSAKEIKKLDRSAGKALKSGRADEAADLYRQLLDATDPGDDRRGDALWVVALARLAADPGDEDGRVFLRELAEELPRQDHPLELGALQAAYAGLDEARAEIDGVRAELDQQAAAFAEERRKAEEAQQMMAGASAEAGERVSKLEGQLRRARAALATCEEELEKKEEALQRLLRLRSGRGSG